MFFLNIYAKNVKFWVSEPNFWEVMGDARPWLMVSWKAHGGLSIRLIELFGYLLRFRDYEAKCVQLGCFRRGSTSLHSKFSWTRSSPSTILGMKRLETLGYPTVKTASFSVPSFWHNAGVWRTDRLTDRRTHGFAVAYTALAYLVLRSAVKIRNDLPLSWYLPIVRSVTTDNAFLLFVVQN